MMIRRLGHRLFQFVSTWVIRFGSVSIGLVVIAGTILYLQQDNLLVRVSMRMLGHFVSSLSLSLSLYGPTCILSHGPHTLTHFFEMSSLNYYSTTATHTIYIYIYFGMCSTFQKSVVYLGNHRTILVIIDPQKNVRYRTNHI